MQVKPRFESYRIIESYELFKDDLNNSICLCLFEVKPNSTDYELVVESYKYWTICSKQQEQWGNKSVSYSSAAYFKEKKKPLLNKEINGILIQELEDGLHNMFVTVKTELIKLQGETEEQFKQRQETIKREQGLKTKFKISTVKE